MQKVMETGKTLLLGGFPLCLHLPPNDKLSANLLPCFLLLLAVYPQCKERKICVVFKANLDKFLETG